MADAIKALTTLAPTINLIDSAALAADTGI